MPNFIVEKGKYIKQDADIPYWWVSLSDLETDRATDLEQFKQENLGVPLDETYKLIKSEWIYQNLNDSGEMEVKPSTNGNNFYLCCDFAQKKDLTALTIIEVIPVEGKLPLYVERKIIETQSEYTAQVDTIFDLFMAFRPEKILIDYTGHGITIYDMLIRKFQENSFDGKRIIMQNTFTLKLKEQMALGFRNIVMPDPISGKSRYRWLHKEKQHQSAIRHCMRVERELLPQGGTRYSGKMHGRDDHFWSKAQIALIEVPTGIVRAHVGKIKRESFIEGKESQTLGQKLLEQINNRRWEMNKEEREAKESVMRERTERFKAIRELKFARQALEKGIVICKTAKKPVHPIHCADVKNCRNPRCPGFKYVDEICSRYNVNKNDL